MKKSNINRLLVGTILAGLPGVVLAAEESGSAREGSPQIESIVVTAQKRSEDIQRVPISITAITAAELEAKGITGFEGVAKNTPSIAYAPYFTSGDTIIVFMRGMGTVTPNQINSESSVGLYEDGFVIGRPTGAVFDLSDPERIEVLRGPQGTLYGRNTTGGTVNIISKQPTGEFGLKQTLDFGNRNMFRTLTAIDLPEWNKISSKVTLLKSGVSGWVKNVGPSNDFNMERQTAGKVQLRWDVSDQFKAEYFVETGNIYTTPGYFQNPQLNGTTTYTGDAYTGADTRRTTTYRPIDLPLSKNHFTAMGGTLTWKLNDALTIKSLTGYRRIRDFNYIDFADSVGFGLTQAPLAHQHQVSQEFQFIGDLADGQINYVAGLYYFTEEAAEYRDLRITALPLGGPVFLNTQSILDRGQSAKTEAAYGQVGWRPEFLNRKFELSVGGRYTEDWRDVASQESSRAALFPVDPLTLPLTTAPLQTGHQRSGKFTPSATINYQWNDDISTYAKVATGYRAGGFYLESSTNPVTSIDPETLLSYEVGIKSFWFDKRLRFNAAAFTSALKNMQTSIITDPITFDSAIFNIGRSRIRGLEVDIAATPVRDLSLSVNYSLLHDKITRVDVRPGSLYDRTANPGSPYSVGDNISQLFAPAFTPRHAFSVSADYTFLHTTNGELAAHLDYRWQGKIYINGISGPAVPNRDLNSVPGYGLLNGRVSYNHDLQGGSQVSVGVWGKNVLDKKYKAVVAGTGSNIFSPVIPNPNGGFVSQNVLWGEPATYGISLSFKY